MDKFLNGFAKFVVKYRWYIIIVFSILTVLSAVGYFFVNLNSDVTSYLDDDTMTAKGKANLSEYFNIIGDLSLGISGLSKEQVETVLNDVILQLNSEEVEIEGKKQYPIVRYAWLGSFDAMPSAMETTGIEAVATALGEGYDSVKDKFYYRNQDTGLETYIVFFYLAAPNAEQVNFDLIDNMSAMLDVKVNGVGGEYFMGGSALNAKTLLESSIGDIPKFLIVAVVLILIILLITSKSFVEPIIFLGTLGISILINIGTNAFMPSVSSITFAASTILQLAIAMDYSIFLMHTYYEEKKLSVDCKTAIENSLPRTLKSIFSSALTTVGGFVALFIMKFNMGFDLGFVLAKGVVASLIAVLFLQPCLIVVMDKLIMRTQHKCFEPKLKAIGKFDIKFRYIIIAVCVAVAIPTCIFQFKVDLSYLTVTEANANPSATEQVVNSSNNQLIVIVPYYTEESSDVQRRLSIDEQYAFLAELDKINTEQQLVAEDGTVRYIQNFSMYTVVTEELYDLYKLVQGTAAAESYEPLFKQLNDNFANVEYGYIMYTIRIDGAVEDSTTYAAIDKITAIGNELFGEGQVSITGVGQGAYDLNNTAPTDFVYVTILSALIILAILIFSNRKVILPLLILFVIELGIWINLTIVVISGVKINFMSYIIISSIELGATVDYAILLTDKFNEARKTMSLRKALNTAIERSSASVLVSASILISACIAVYLVTSNLIVGEITMLIARGAVLSAFLVFTLLPAILYSYTKVYAKLKERIAARKSGKTKELPPSDEEN